MDEYNGIEKLINTYYNCIRTHKMTLNDVPERYRHKVEVYYNEMEKKRAHT